MRILSIAMFIITTILFVSCGDNESSSSGKEQATTKTKKNKKLDISNEEGFMTFLNLAKINLPEDAKFVKVEKKNSGYRAEFKIANVLPAGREEYDAWLKKEAGELEAEGWRKMVMRDNDKMFTGYVNEYIFYPPKNIDKKVDKIIAYGITISTAYIEKNSASEPVNEYTIIISED
jgi:hypothetical protein